MPDKPVFTLMAIGEVPDGRLVMEPAGGEYQLPTGKGLRIEVYERWAGATDDDADVTIEHGPGRLTIWLDTQAYRIWNEAGAEITNQAL